MEDRLLGEYGIIELVDPICRDSADTQYMLIQTNFSKSPEQLTYKPLVVVVKFYLDSIAISTTE